MRRGLELGGLRICFLLGLPLVEGFFFVSYFRFFRRALLLNRFLLLLNFLVLRFFVPAYQVWRRIKFPRLLCSRSYAAIFNYLLFFYLPFDPFFCRAYGGFRLLGFNFIPFFFFFYIVCSVVDVITIFHCLALFLSFFFFFCSLTVYCTLYSLPRSLLGPTPGYPLGPRGPTCSEDYCQDRIC